MCLLCCKCLCLIFHNVQCVSVQYELYTCYILLYISHFPSSKQRGIFLFSCVVDWVFIHVLLVITNNDNVFIKNKKIHHYIIDLSLYSLCSQIALLSLKNIFESWLLSELEYRIIPWYEGIFYLLVILMPMFPYLLICIALIEVFNSIQLVSGLRHLWNF